MRDERDAPATLEPDAGDEVGLFAATLETGSLEPRRANEPLDPFVSSSASAYVPGPFQACPVGAADVARRLPRTVGSFASGGFRPRALDEETDEPICREPQSVVVTTMILGVVLAAAGYLLDVR